MQQSMLSPLNSGLFSLSPFLFVLGYSCLLAPPVEPMRFHCHWMFPHPNLQEITPLCYTVLTAFPRDACWSLLAVAFCYPCILLAPPCLPPIPSPFTFVDTPFASFTPLASFIVTCHPCAAYCFIALLLSPFALIFCY